jgi:hypothetical protein
MIIDFHVHIFPDSIAQEAVDKMSEFAGVPHYGNGALSGLLEYMKLDRIDLSVNQPVATKPEQVVSINRKMVQLNNKGLPVINFGSMHPDFPDVEDEIIFMKQNGIKGIKLHSEYQSFYPDEDKMLPIYESCAKHGIIILFHAGIDLGYPEAHTTPARLKQVLSVKNLKIVLAHMGSYRMWDEVTKHLIGQNAYFDLAYCNEMDDSLLKQMILAHGLDKILFATDFPWERANKLIDKISRLGLGSEFEQKIYYTNAKELLKL